MFAYICKFKYLLLKEIWMPPQTQKLNGLCLVLYLKIQNNLDLEHYFRKITKKWF